MKAMSARRKLVRFAAFWVPIAMFVAIPVLKISTWRYFYAYVVGYVVIAGILQLLKRKVDGSWSW